MKKICRFAEILILFAPNAMMRSKPAWSRTSRFNASGAKRNIAGFGEGSTPIKSSDAEIVFPADCATSVIKTRQRSLLKKVNAGTLPVIPAQMPPQNDLIMKPAPAEKQEKARKPTRDAEGSIIKKVEKRRTSNGKTREETIYFARVRYTDNLGKKREKKRRAETYNDAITVRRQLQDEIRDESAEIEEQQKPKTFDELADYFEAEFVKEAVYVGDQKVGGMREELETVRRQVKLFRETFAGRLLKNITYEDLRRYKEKRLATDVKKILKIKHVYQDENGKRRVRYTKKEQRTPRGIVSVHRELARLRRMLNIAVRQNWLDKNPFNSGESLISAALETERVRILSLTEEKRLLAVCTGKREHLKTIIIFAIDTFMRKGEIFKLKWADVDMEKRQICIRARNTKTGKQRFTPISARLKSELETLKKGTFLDEAENLVFGIKTDADHAFDGARLAAEIEDLHFHDLRGTGITRMLRANLPAAEIIRRVHNLVDDSRCFPVIPAHCKRLDLHPEKRLEQKDYPAWHRSSLLGENLNGVFNRRRQ